MAQKIERIALTISIAAFAVAAIAGWVALDQRSTRLPASVSKQEIGGVIRTHQEDLYRNSDDPVLGNPDGDVTLVEFFDYRCTYCKQVHPVVMQLLWDDGNIRYVAKEYPILGPVSTVAAQAALASQKQGKYAAFSNALMSARSLNEDLVFKIAQDIGMDPIRLLDDIDALEDDISQTIANNITLAKQLGLQGTPAFIAGESLVPGATSRSGLEKLISDARALNATR